MYTVAKDVDRYSATNVEGVMVAANALTAEAKISEQLAEYQNHKIPEHLQRQFYIKTLLQDK